MRGRRRSMGGSRNESRRRWWPRSPSSVFKRLRRSGITSGPLAGGDVWWSLTRDARCCRTGCALAPRRATLSALLPDGPEIERPGHEYQAGDDRARPAVVLEAERDAVRAGGSTDHVERAECDPYDAEQGEEEKQMPHR